MAKSIGNNLTDIIEHGIVVITNKERTNYAQLEQK